MNGRQVSWLFVPGDAPQRIARALASPADVVVLDLADGVPLARKTAARTEVARVLESPEAAARCFVRISVQGSDDLERTRRQMADCGAARRAAGLVLPRCEGPADIVALSARIARQQAVVAIVTGTARGVQYLADFREPLPGLVGLMWAAEDLAADLHGRGSRDAHGDYHGPYAAARDATLVAARAIGVSAIDAIFPDPRDPAGLTRECALHRTLGFDAKAAIDPDQLAAIHDAFAPGEAELAWALRVLAVRGGGRREAGIDSGMLDPPHVRQARQLLGLGPGPGPESSQGSGGWQRRTAAAGQGGNKSDPC